MAEGREGEGEGAGGEAPLTAPNSEAVLVQAQLMFNRRELLLGAAGSVTGVSFKRPPVTLDLVIGPHEEPGIVRAVLDGVEVEALKGIDASMMHAAERTCSPWLTMALRPGEARVSLSEPNRECVISLRNGCEGFVASWALPIVQQGVIGYYPAEDLPVLLSAGAGEYWCLREGEEAPSALAKATAAYACFFGDYEERTFERIQVVVERLARAMGPGTPFIFNAVIHPAHEPAVLLTAFTR